MKDLDEYGGPLEIYSASAFFKRPVIVINSEIVKPEIYNYRCVGEEEVPDREPILLGFMPSLPHYEPLEYVDSRSGDLLTPAGLHLPKPLRTTRVSKIENLLRASAVYCLV